MGGLTANGDGARRLNLLGAGAHGQLSVRKGRVNVQRLDPMPLAGLGPAVAVLLLDRLRRGAIDRGAARDLRMVAWQRHLDQRLGGHLEYLPGLRAPARADQPQRLDCEAEWLAQHWQV